ncbi:unnamed protein product (mitochondrion) [Plasmodiophora brassicae]|uniref:WW domain-containing protein n=1 Tax=Plasmodiophora brassicae TaxID=37360 RepID=A0A0G4IYH8_PLABS|nr:hypothetical protein PBRA_001444 [Plasmodiophora brassicae]SPQ94100.1 unnamed protein product [Plasmodiophora brassicae]
MGRRVGDRSMTALRYADGKVGCDTNVCGHNVAVRVGNVLSPGMSSSKLWYYCDVAGNQQGPVAATALVAELTAGRITAEGLIWSDGLPNWCPLNEVQDIASLIPKSEEPQSPAKAKGLSSKANSDASAIKPPVRSTATSTDTKKLPARVGVKPSPESGDESGKANSAKSASKWTKVVGADGYPYFVNSETQETTWDQPDDYVDDEIASAATAPAPATAPASSAPQSRSVGPPRKTAPEGTKPALAPKVAAPPPSTLVTTSPSAAPANDEASKAISSLKSAFETFKSDSEKVHSELKATVKSLEKAHADYVAAHDKLVKDLKSEAESNKKTVADLRQEVNDLQKALSAAQDKLKTVSSNVDGVSSNVKSIKAFAKSLADGLKE